MTSFLSETGNRISWDGENAACHCGACNKRIAIEFLGGQIGLHFKTMPTPPFPLHPAHTKAGHCGTDKRQTQPPAT